MSNLTWFETKLDDGTPIKVGYQINPKEPSVGVMSDYPELMEAETLEGGTVRDFTDKEEDRIIEEAIKHLSELEYPSEDWYL